MRKRLQSSLWFQFFAASVLIGALSLNIFTLNDLRTNILWIAAQQLPESFSGQLALTRWTWALWETSSIIHDLVDPLEIHTIYIQNIPQDDIASYLKRHVGSDWRRHPLLLKGLWSEDDLLHPDRKLNLAGLLKESLKVPYFLDARDGGISPDAEASIQHVVASIVFGKQPHKLATQLLIQQEPSLIKEVVPRELVEKLFGGSFFDASSVVGSGPFNLFPALTTIPLFVAGAQDIGKDQPYTPLHSEPICNIAVQLSGRKDWTLVEARHWKYLRPTVAPDGRAFVASKASGVTHVPRYTVTTEAGDALWLPAWTWHRVDYSFNKSDGADMSTTISIAASLFHFRVWQFFDQNVVFAIAIMPALVRELLGLGIQ